MASTASGVRSVFVLIVAGHLSVTGFAILTPECYAAGLPAGEIVVTAKISTNDPGLMLIDPVTGNRAILSDNTHGTGMPFTNPYDVSVMSNGDLLVADGGTPYQSADSPMPVPDSLGTPGSLPPATPTRLYIVDPTTGNRTVISQDSLTASNPAYPEIGSGPAFGTAAYARQVGNQILVSAADNNGDPNFTGRLMSVDPATGNRAIFSNFNVGTGPAPEWMGGMVASGNLLFAPGYFQGLFKIDLATGNRTLLSGASAGAGPAFTVGYSAAAYGGQIYVSGAGQSSNAATYGVFRIDPVTGNRSVVSSGTVGSGPVGSSWPMQMAIESGGTILVTLQGGNNSNGLLTIDPLTGNRAFLSDATHGSGPLFTDMNGITVVPLSGDANGDGIVNAQDLATIASQWNHNGYFLQGDLNNDGIVNGQDLALASSNWLGTSLGHGDFANANTMAPVSEPAALGLAIAACIAWSLRSCRMERRATVFILLILAILAASTRAAGLPAGDIVVSGRISDDDTGLLLINPTTGNRTILSDNSHGTGLAFSFPEVSAVLPNGQLLITDSGNPIGPSVGNLPPADPDRIYLVDPATGNRTVIGENAMPVGGASPMTFPQIGSGPAFDGLGAATLTGTQILAVDGTTAESPGQLFLINPATGDHTIVSGASVGTGPSLNWTGGLVASDNTAIVATVYSGLVKVDLTTGNRTSFSGTGAGSGATLTSAADVLSLGGQLYVTGAGGRFTDNSTYGLFRIDPNTGNRTLIAGPTVGSGPFGTNGPGALASEPGGAILMTANSSNDASPSALLTVDPTTGNRMILSDATHGSGPAIVQFYTVLTVPLFGDANNDGIVNGQDLATIASQWNHSGSFQAGDLNNDGIVNAQDLALASSNWLGTSLGQGGTANMSNVSPVPEPATILLSLVASAALVVTRLRPKLISPRVRSRI